MTTPLTNNTVPITSGTIRATSPCPRGAGELAASGGRDQTGVQHGVSAMDVDEVESERPGGVRG